MLVFLHFILHQSRNTGKLQPHADQQFRHRTIGVSVNWDRSDSRRNAEGPTESLSPAISRTVVELLTLGGVLKQTRCFAPTGPQTITSTQIVAALGTETDFVLRAWFESAGRRSIKNTMGSGLYC